MFGENAEVVASSEQFPKFGGEFLKIGPSGVHFGDDLSLSGSLRGVNRVRVPVLCVENDIPFANSQIVTVVIALVTGIMWCRGI